MANEELEQPEAAAPRPSAPKVNFWIQATGWVKGNLPKSLLNLCFGSRFKTITTLVSLLCILMLVLTIVAAEAYAAQKRGATPGSSYAGASGGICPSTKGALNGDNSFDETGDQVDVDSVPDPSSATLTETLSANMTTYCPKKGQKDNSGTEGGEGMSFGIKGGVGAVAVPDLPSRFPLGRTVLDIPGIGLRVAVDHGGLIQANHSDKGPGNIDIDLFVGWADTATSPCDRYSSRWVPSSLISGIKVYVFQSWSDADAHAHVKNYSNQAACLAANNLLATGGGNQMIVNVARQELANWSGSSSKYGGGGKAWCAFFVSWILQHAGYNIGSEGHPQSVLDWIKDHGGKVTDMVANPNLSNVQPGDIVLFDGAASESTTHIGIAVAVSANHLTTIDGNVSDSVGARSGEVQMGESSHNSNTKGLVQVRDGETLRIKEVGRLP